MVLASELVSPSNTFFKGGKYSKKLEKKEKRVNLTCWRESGNSIRNGRREGTERAQTRKGGIKIRGGEILILPFSEGIICKIKLERGKGLDKGVPSLREEKGESGVLPDRKRERLKNYA